MALYAIGDLHLSHSANKPMDVFGGKWQNYMEKLKKGLSVLTDDDTIVLCGDMSWAMGIDDALEDFRYIDSLPGTKIILKGNHDYWWNTASKITKFFAEHEIKSIKILHNNCFYYEDVAICGTRGWFFEENVHGGEHDKKIMNREIGRLAASLDAAKDVKEKLVFLHYPPRFNNFICREIIALLEKHEVKHCYYGHLHGEGHKFAVTGEVEGINYHMVSADYIDFHPIKVR
ncbi:MAG: metallophosphoesterase [Oscillospiraceae bacterium]|nr:metallophosphoesterase [Oscillospiraceae bacterium]